MKPARTTGGKRRTTFWRRQITHAGIAFAIFGVSLAIGIWGYASFESLPLTDAFLNASMILGGMGPVKTDLSEPGKVFAGFYALYSGLVVIAVAGLLLAPGVHHLMNEVNWGDPPEGE